MNDFKYPLGIEVEDVVTKFKGIATYRAQYLTGCNNYGVQAPLDKDGNVGKMEQFDENRLVKTGEGIELPNNYSTEEKKKKADIGGPQPKVKVRRKI